MLIYDDLLAVLALDEEEHNHISIRLYDADELWDQAQRSGAQDGAEPVAFVPRDVKPSVAQIKMQPTNITASSTYVVWTNDRNLYFKKHDDTQIFVKEGNWHYPRFVGEHLIVYGSPEREEYDDEEEMGDRYPIDSGQAFYDIGLDTDKIEKIYSFDEEVIPEYITSFPQKLDVVSTG